MRAKWVRSCCWLVGLSLLVGCSPVERKVPELTVSADRYNLLWEATLDVLEDYFPILVSRQDEGVIISDYKVGGSLLEPWDQEARQPYYRLEETLHVVRRRAVAHLEKTDGDYRLRLRVIKERQAYRPPEAAFSSSYDLYDLTLSERREMLEEAPAESTPVRPFGRSPAGDQTTERQDRALASRRGRGVESPSGPRPLSAEEASLTWYPLEDDSDLAREMVLAIARRLAVAGKLPQPTDRTEKPPAR